jgi:DNA-binding CsgD family transcriptional regulator
LPANGIDAAIEMVQIATAAVRIEDRATALLDRLRRVVPFQAACVSLYDPGRSRYDSLVSEGYSSRLLDFFDSPDMSTHVELLALHEFRHVLPARYLARPLRDVRVWAEHLLPAGFRDGLSVGLYSPDGRHLGMLAVNTESAGHLTDSACALIDRLAPVIATAIDPMLSIASAARMVTHARAGVVLDVAGNALALPGLPSHPLLRPGSPVLSTALARSAKHGAQTSFLCPHVSDGVPGHVRITVLGDLALPYRHLSAVILVSDPGDLAGITHRELEVLGFLVDGWSNQRIAAGLGVSDRTVAAHVEHILAKLRAPSRTAAAVRAVRRGMYVPRDLSLPVGSGR